MKKVLVASERERAQLLYGKNARNAEVLKPRLSVVTCAE